MKKIILALFLFGMGISGISFAHSGASTTDKQATISHCTNSTATKNCKTYTFFVLKGCQAKQGKPCQICNDDPQGIANTIEDFQKDNNISLMDAVRYHCNRESGGDPRCLKYLGYVLQHCVTPHNDVS